MARWPFEHVYDAQVGNAAGRYGVPASLVKGIIAAESAFRADAYRKESTAASDWPAGVTEDASRGLMQLLYWRAQDLGYRGGAEGLHDPATNIELGTKLLAINKAQLGTWDRAISAYNGGIRPDLGFGIPLPSGAFRNQEYVNRVRNYWHYFETGEWTAGAATGGLVLALAFLGVMLVPFSVALERLH